MWTYQNCLVLLLLLLLTQLYAYVASCHISLVVVMTSYVDICPHYAGCYYDSCVVIVMLKYFSFKVEFC